MHGIRLIGLLPQNFTVQRAGFFESAGAMVFDGKLQRFWGSHAVIRNCHYRNAGPVRIQPEATI
jgi:hypothetical protein